MTQGRPRVVTNGMLLGGLLLLVLLVAAGAAYLALFERAIPPDVYTHEENQNGGLTLWWGRVADDVAQTSLTSVESNIHRSDYAGPESCKTCHPKNYEEWSQHPHRWMNALADDSSVKGDFSGQRISFMGGDAFFYLEDGEYRMRIERGGQHAKFSISQTIGSRFFQYYVGQQIEGDFPADHAINNEDHVLPFGYWLGASEWVPVVHVADSDEYPDATHTDPFNFFDYSFPQYHVCNMCHTTFPMAESLSRTSDKLCRHAPLKMHWAVAGHLSEEHPELLKGRSKVTSRNEAYRVFDEMQTWEAPEHAVTLGISCEACHLGAKKHAENEKVLPEFFPKSPHLLVDADADQVQSGRSHMNVNWACGRCHAGDRPQMAAGLSTWNSTELSDAFRGGCYTKLTCIHCHNPHQAIGEKWTRTPDEDDASCIQCHEKFESSTVRRAHTHHPAGSAGDRCMNCHMPKMNEGLQDVVRTHMIFSPTNRDMIEANHSNACNLCHTEKPITWTVQHLNEWYDADIPDSLTREFYPERDEAVAVGWLHSEYEQVRLVAAAALAQNGDQWALPHLVRALDDPYLLNRQFARIGLEEMLGIDLFEKYGYRFYMMPDERREPIGRVWKDLVE